MQNVRRELALLEASLMNKNGKSKPILHNTSIILEDYVSGYPLEKQPRICWLCCHKFESLPVSIPETYEDGVFRVIGVFCIFFVCVIIYQILW